MSFFAIVKKGIGFYMAENRNKDVFQMADDICAVSLIMIFVIRLCGLLYFNISRS